MFWVFTAQILSATTCISSYSLALNYVIYSVYLWLIRINHIALDSPVKIIKHLWFELLLTIFMLKNFG